MAVLLALTLLAGAAPAATQVLVEFLGADASTYVTLRTEAVRAAREDSTWADSTWVDVRALDGTVISRDLVRARTVVRHREEAATPWRESRETFHWGRSLEGWLEGREIAPGIPVAGVAAETGFSRRGMHLEGDGESALILPVEECLRYLPAYRDLERQGELRVLAVYHVSPRYYFVVQGDCMGTDRDCGSAVVPVPQDVVREAHQRLGGNARTRR